MKNGQMGGSLGIKQAAVEPFLKNGYILTCRQTQQGVYIDPGDEAPQLNQWVEQNEVQLIAIVNTHAHVDHICGINDVKAKWDVPIYLHADDEFLYQGIEEQARSFGLRCSVPPPVDSHLAEGQELAIGRLGVKVHHTPGHSPGGVSLEVGEHVFCGDALFAGSIGRTDLPGGSYETLLESIQEKILPLGDAKILHPGHGPETTIGRERQTNPFLASG